MISYAEVKKNVKNLQNIFLFCSSFVIFCFQKV